MTSDFIDAIAAEIDVRPAQVRAAVELLEADATVPFIARYRKEATGSLDEVALTAIRDRLAQLKELAKRREAIVKSLDERGLLTDELRAKVDAAASMAELEDVYLPYRPKRRTRATIAREKGLEPLAAALFEQDPAFDPAEAASRCVDPEKGVDRPADALAGARDIVAEWINEDQTARARLRTLFEEEGEITSKVISGQEEAGAKFRDYFDCREAVKTLPGHRLLAMRRGEAEGVLYLRMRPPEEAALAVLDHLFVRNDSASGHEVATAVRDGYQRLLGPSLETELRLTTKQKADREAIRVFADNLRHLLLAPPLGRQRILAVDPGFRTGCKVVCLDEQGGLLHTDVFHVMGSQEALAAAARTVTRLCREYRPQAIAVGSGTAGRETEDFLRKLDLGPPVVMVNESGASIYSASDAARREFPDLDLTFRGAVSIGRRLMDPLAELVKIDPKSIGVGQYQHDVNQTDLKKSLDDVVVSCVNRVGVEVNTASLELLTYVSGLGPSLAQKIVEYRAQKGPFTSRRQLLDVPRLGPKAFEQAAGFLRIRDAEHPLDASAVHPESYPVVERMARDLSCRVVDLLDRDEPRGRIEIERYVDDRIGLPTLTDILAELAKPGRDPRDEFAPFAFDDNVHDLQDLTPGMRLPGVVTNVTRFGAFVDVGVHQDGLVHISQLADRFVQDPHQVVKVHQQVTVTVLDVDLDRRRIALSMRQNPETEGEAGTGGRNQSRGGKSKKKESRPKDAPFNNPFAAAFKK
jgi:uncharacterized protein